MKNTLILLLWIGHVSADVLCGGHYAATCKNCPEGDNGAWYGASWCNGECTWDTAANECVSDLKDCGGESSATTCSECDASSPCSSSECTWHDHTSLCRDAYSDDIRTASVHLSYDAPILEPAWWLQRMIPTATADVTYFASNGHRFGYGGIQQVDSNTGRVIFSVWDQGGCDQDVDPNCSPDNIAQFTACGEGVTCTSFGGEGTGRKSYFDILGSFPIVGEEYYFVTQAEYLGNRRMEYTGYFFMGGSWRLLSRIQVSTNVNEEWWLGGLYSFVEQWTTVDTTTKDRSALYGPSFLASSDGSNLVQINTATFTHGTLENHEHVNAWQAGAEQDYAVGIATGGNVLRYASNGQQFSYKAITPDAELLDFVQRIPCLNDANSKGEIESCVKDEEPPTVVNCGGHTAPSCAKCPQGNGEAWCNGECQWFNNECVEQRPCEDSSDWTFKQRNGNIRNCKWVGRKTKRRCRKIGEDGTTAYEGCPKSCGSC